VSEILSHQSQLSQLSQRSQVSMVLRQAPLSLVVLHLAVLYAHPKSVRVGVVSWGGDGWSWLGKVCAKMVAELETRS